YRAHYPRAKQIGRTSHTARRPVGVSRRTTERRLWRPQAAEALPPVQDVQRSDAESIFVSERAAQGGLINPNSPRLCRGLSQREPSEPPAEPGATRLWLVAADGRIWHESVGGDRGSCRRPGKRRRCRLLAWPHSRSGGGCAFFRSGWPSAGRYAVCH